MEMVWCGGDGDGDGDVVGGDVDCGRVDLILGGGRDERGG